MSETRRHYDEHLGPIYAWMAGPFEAASRASGRVFEELRLQPGSSGVAIDLGCGHGLHSVALARRDFHVIAVDTCALLLRQLEGNAAGLSVETVHADVVTWREGIPPRADVVICMGDTLTHLAGAADVADLIRTFAAVLTPGGFFITSFRDYVSSPPEGDRRFIPVRSDEDRILTCFLEFQERTVRVHDLVHDRSELGWNLTVSSYDKLRLRREWVMSLMRESKLRLVMDRTDQGMVTLAASKDL